MKTATYDKSMVIAPLPERLRREIGRLVEDETRAEAAPKTTLRLNGLVLLYDECPDTGTSALPRLRRVSAVKETSLFSTEYRVELHQFGLTTELSPKKSAGQLAVTPEDGETVVINLPLYRYLCMHALVSKGLHASSLELSERGPRAITCTRDDLEETFYRFGESYDFVQASEMAAEQIVDFVQLIKSELKKFGVRDFIAGRLNTGFYLNTSPQNVAFLPATVPWLEEVE